MDNRRKDERFPVNEEAVFWINGRILKMILQDLSRSGMRLVTEYPLTQGSEIIVALRGLTLSGTVQHSTRVGDRFTIGVDVKQPMERFIKDIAKVDLALMDSVQPK